MSVPNYTGKKYWLCNAKFVKDAYTDQYGIKHSAYIYDHQVEVIVIDDRFDWAVPDYKGQGPYEPYGKIHYLTAIDGGDVEYRCVQNWDSGRMDMWRNQDGESYMIYQECIGRAPVIFGSKK